MSVDSLTVNFVIYNPTSGEIVRSGDCSSEWVDGQAGPGLSAAIAEGSDELDWFDVSTMEAKKKSGLSVAVTGLSIAADGDEATIISPVPAGCFVTWPDGQRDEVLDGSVEFSTEDVGTHTIVLDGPKYLPLEIDIEAHD